MKAPVYREHIHHVGTMRGVSTYQIKTSAGEKAEVLATVVVKTDNQGMTVWCVSCNGSECKHAQKIREKRGS